MNENIFYLAESFLNDQISEEFIYEMAEKGLFTLDEFSLAVDSLVEASKLTFDDIGMETLDMKDGASNKDPRDLPGDMNKQGPKIATEALDSFIEKSSRQAMTQPKVIKEKEDSMSKILAAKMLSGKK